MLLPLRGLRSGFLACLLLPAGCAQPPRLTSGTETTPAGNSTGQTQPARTAR